MSIENVKAYFRTFGIENRIIELNESSATVQLAAAALHCEPARIAKTLSFQVNEDAVLVVTAGDTKIDNAKFKHYFGVKAKMLPHELVDDIIGHSVGGVCPFAVKPDVKVYLDISMKRFETVYPACGSSNSAVEMNMADLEKYSASIAWVDVCKGY